MQVVVRPAAAADMDDAWLWYESQRPGLGSDFLLATQAVVDSIVENPFRYSVVLRNTRRALLRRFPYGIYFRVYDDVVVIVACMHGRRDPRRWQSRGQ